MRARLSMRWDRAMRRRLAFGDRIRILAQEVKSRRFFRRKLGLFRHRLLLGDFGEELDVAVALETGARRNETAHDDIFLQATQVIDLSGDSRFGEDAGRLLETRRGDKRIRGERRLGDAKEQRTPDCGATSVLDDAFVLFAEAELIDLLLEEERGVADVFDLHPAHHLADDGLDVLVVDVDALQAVDLLHGVDEIGLRVLFAEDGENVVRIERAVNERLAGAHVFALLHIDVRAAGNGVFLHGASIFAFDVNLALPLGDFAVLHDAVDFADDGRIARLARFEEFDDARQTTGNVFGLGSLARNLCEHVSGLHIVAIGDHQVSASGHEVFALHAALRILDHDGRLMLFVAERQRDDELRKTGDFVHLLFDGEAGLQILELDRPAGLGEDREGVRIPFAERLAKRDWIAFLELQAGAVHDVVAFLFTALFVDNGDQAGAVHRNESL